MISAINFMDTNYYSTDVDYNEENEQTQESTPHHEGYEVKTRKVGTSSSNILSNINYLSVLGQAQISSTSSVSSVSSVSSTVSAKVQTLAKEMISLQNQLAELAADGTELYEYDTSSDEVKNYQTKYLQMYNQLVEKKEEYDNYVKEAGLSDAQTEKITQSIADKQDKTNTSISNKISNIEQQMQQISQKELNLINQGVELDDDQFNQLEEQYATLLSQGYPLAAQQAISKLDLLSSNTTLQKIPEDIANLAIEYDKITEQRQILLFKTAELADSNTDSDKIDKLVAQDEEAAKKQDELLEQIAQKSKNENFDTSDVTFQALFNSNRMSNIMFDNDLTYEITAIENKIEIIDYQLNALSDSSDSTEKDQLKAIREIYELELQNLKNQQASLDIDNFSKRFDTTEESIKTKI